MESTDNPGATRPLAVVTGASSGIGFVQLATGKNVGAAEHGGSTVAPYQKDLQPRAPVAQHDHAGGGAGRGVNDAVVEFHGLPRR